MEKYFILKKSVLRSIKLLNFKINLLNDKSHDKMRNEEDLGVAISNMLNWTIHFQLETRCEFLMDQATPP